MSEVMNVPEGWEVKPLSYCVDIANSNVDKKYHDDETEVKLCNYTDVYSNNYIDKTIDFMVATATKLEIKKFELRENDVIITKDSESPDDIGIPAHIREDLPNVLCGYHLTLLRPKLNCDGKFLSSALESNRYKKYFGALASGSTRFALSLGVISNTPMLLPPKNEQQKIAKILSILDQTIEATQKLIAKEKNIKKGLMHDLLTNGIDEDGKIRSPQTHNYKESELGLIPEGWEVEKLDNLISKVMDYRGRTPLKLGMEWGDGLIPSLSANNVQMGTINFKKETHLGSEKLFEKWMTKGRTKEGDILFTMEAPLGAKNAPNRPPIAFASGQQKRSTSGHPCR